MYNTARMSLRSQQKKERVVYMDFETTGLNIFQCEIIEVALCDNLGHRYEAFIQIDGTISDFVQRLTSITNEILKTHGRSHREVITNICNFINGKLGFLYNGNYDINPADYIVGHNLLQFDLPLLNVHIHRCNSKNKLNKANCLSISNKIKVIDTLIIAQKYYTISDDPLQPYKRKYSLENLSVTFNFKNRPSHRAMSDVLATVELLEIVQNELSKHNRPNSIESIYNDGMQYHTK